MGLCLPRRRRATSAASRPSTLSVPSTTNQSRLTSCGLAEKVFIDVPRTIARPRMTAIRRKPVIVSELGAACQTRHILPESGQKKRSPRGLREIHTKGGGWRRHRMDQPANDPTAGNYPGPPHAVQDIFVQRRKNVSMLR